MSRYEMGHLFTGGQVFADGGMGRVERYKFNGSSFRAFCEALRSSELMLQGADSNAPITAQTCETGSIVTMGATAGTPYGRWRRAGSMIEVEFDGRMYAGGDPGGANEWFWKVLWHAVETSGATHV